tara:strand:+ start:3396 stop:3671 length:276 start_codon:yes stop_codon:yes gene_type:complete
MESSRTINDSFKISKGGDLSTYHSDWQKTVNLSFSDRNEHGDRCEIEVKVPYALAEELALALTTIVAEHDKRRAEEKAQAEAEAAEVSSES